MFFQPVFQAIVQSAKKSSISSTLLLLLLSSVSLPSAHASSPCLRTYMGAVVFSGQTVGQQRQDVEDNDDGAMALL